ncbi:ion transporter [Pseudoxanthomonas wuyuanensis]|uniref:Voltage-gated potassium channel n=1 Tax=Pseudoxanthomonas wuyuanensis TaxID=1073196 RepID=A0A286D391_9GAMM|nr:ion transporter [Pseudoxanthomonas wuyuanensis]KAF1722994.1 ion transporter [Pseudoxanthomonas wuyuanensis]SOD53119.1 voltage-gated potassium channel [Pseudoxanthomonas wuyuanensis]
MRLLSAPQLNPASEDGWRRRWFDIIFRHDTPPARNFDLLLVLAIVTSVTVIVADSVADIHARYGGWLYALEWGFTILFSAEYALRLATVKRPLRYALSIWGVIDLLSILPTYLSLLLPGSQSLLVVRVLRILRLFRILKLTQYVEESGVLLGALWRSRRKILVFVSTVLTLVVIFGALMYLIEGPQHGFTSIPTSMYWAIVTMATVGFGDIAPQTTFGRLVTSVLILIGYSIIAVPTGIYTAELVSSLREAEADRGHLDRRGCPDCGLEGHEPEALHCRHCGHPLPAPTP